MQWCLQTGTDYCELNDLHKPLYLEAAGVRLVEFGIKGTVSVFSLLSGLHRKDILKPVNMPGPRGKGPVVSQDMRPKNAVVSRHRPL
jgi:hypothetical protein